MALDNKVRAVKDHGKKFGYGLPPLSVESSIRARRQECTNQKRVEEFRVKVEEHLAKMAGKSRRLILNALSQQK